MGFKLCDDNPKAEKNRTCWCLEMGNQKAWFNSPILPLNGEYASRFWILYICHIRGSMNEPLERGPSQDAQFYLSKWLGMKTPCCSHQNSWCSWMLNSPIYKHGFIRFDPSPLLVEGCTVWLWASLAPFKLFKGVSIHPWWKWVHTPRFCLWSWKNNERIWETTMSPNVRMSECLFYLKPSLSKHVLLQQGLPCPITMTSPMSQCQLVPIGSIMFNPEPGI